VRNQADSRLGGDVLEPAVTVVLEQGIATADRRDEQILIAVVVDVSECRAHADAIGERDAGIRA
jgi:hypothetical protein